MIWESSKGFFAETHLQSTQPAVFLRAVNDRGGESARFLGTFIEDLVYVVEVVFELGSAGSGFFKIIPVVFEEGFLEVAVAEAAGSEVVFGLLREVGGGE